MFYNTEYGTTFLDKCPMCTLKMCILLLFSINVNKIKFVNNATQLTDFLSAFSVNYCISLLIFYRLFLPFIEGRILQSTTTVYLSISPCNFITFWFIYLKALLLVYRHLWLVYHIDKMILLSLWNGVFFFNNILCSGIYFFLKVSFY